jgi:hypothetical protein
MGAFGDGWTWCEGQAKELRFEVPSVNKQHVGYATGQLVTLNLFRQRIRPS